MIKAGIVGGAGYTGGELIRILLNHPDVSLRFVHSTSNAGKFLYQVHADLIGETNLVFSDCLSDDIDVLFLCMGHGDAKAFLENNTINDSIRIIDLSQDFRLNHASSFGNRRFVYGLPELNKTLPILVVLLQPFSLLYFLWPMQEYWDIFIQLVLQAQPELDKVLVLLLILAGEPIILKPINLWHISM